MLPLVKSLIFIVYYLNDGLVINYIRQGDCIENMNFFHGSHNIALQIQKNCVSLMNFLKINYENEFSSYMKTHKDELQRKEFRKLKIGRKLRRLIYYTLELTSLISNNIDHYLNGLRKLLDQNKEIYLKHSDDNLSSLEINYVNFLNDKKEVIEKNYMNYYNLTITFDDLKNSLSKIIEDFFTFVGIKQTIPIENESIIDEDDKIDDSNLFLQSKSGIIKIYKKNKLRNHSYFQLLLNKSFFLFSLIKFLKIQNDLDNLRKKNKIEVSSLDYSIIDGMLKVLYFYINDNPDNCSLVLSSKFFQMMGEMDVKIIGKFIDFYVICFKTLKKYNYVLSSFNPQIKFLLKMTKRFKVIVV
jgi:hypothetical protein